MAVTPKQARFVEEYLQDLNATQAAIRAGYSEKTANEQAAQLLKKPEVAAAIEAAKGKRSERADIDALWVLKRLHDEATADLDDLYENDGSLKPISDWPEIWRQGLVQGIEVEELFEGRGEDRKPIGRVRKIKLDSRVKRIELIGRHVGVKAFEETLNVKGMDGLADRLARLSRALVREDDAKAVPATVPVPEQKSKRLPEPREVRKEPDFKKPLFAPKGGDDWRGPSKPTAPPVSAPYRPLLPWPEQPATAAADYDPLKS